MDRPQRILSKKTKAMCVDYSAQDYRIMRRYLKINWLGNRLERGW